MGSKRAGGGVQWSFIALVIQIPAVTAMGGGQRPFGTFLKIHPFWWRHPSLSICFIFTNLKHIVHLSIPIFIPNIPQFCHVFTTVHFEAWNCRVEWHSVLNYTLWWLVLGKIPEYRCSLICILARLYRYKRDEVWVKLNKNIIWPRSRKTADCWF